MQFIDNKYTKWYFQIIFAAQKRTEVLNDYTELHHIIPRSLGGTNDPENLVTLTGREHFVCHLLLVKMTTGLSKSSMAYAAWQMTHINGRDRYVPTSKVYEMLKRQMSLALKGKSFEERYGAEKALRVKQKLGVSRYGRKPMLGKKHSAETKQKIADAKTGVSTPKSAETKKRMSDTWKKMAPDRSGAKNPMFSKTQTESAKKLISAANSGKNNGMFGKYDNAPMVVCPHCKRTGKQGPNFTRWHFNQCKENNAK